MLDNTRQVKRARMWIQAPRTQRREDIPRRRPTSGRHQVGYPEVGEGIRADFINSLFITPSLDVGRQWVRHPDLGEPLRQDAGTGSTQATVPSVTQVPCPPEPIIPDEVNSLSMI
jgi:hypothetical protein